MTYVHFRFLLLWDPLKTIVDLPGPYIRSSLLCICEVASLPQKVYCESLDTIALEGNSNDYFFINRNAYKTS